MRHRNTRLLVGIISLAVLAFLVIIGASFVLYAKNPGGGNPDGWIKLAIVAVGHTACPAFGVGLAVLAGGLVLHAYVRRKGKLYRRTFGLCPGCGYDLRGNPGAATCPECGAAQAASSNPGPLSRPARPPGQDSASTRQP